MTTTAILAIIGVATGMGALFAFLILDQTNSPVAGAFSLMLFLITVAVFVTALSLDSDARRNRDRTEQRAIDHINRVISAACYPKVVTNRAEHGNAVVFDCARDGRLRSVTIRH